MKLLCLMLALLAPVAVSGADDVNVTTSPDGTMEAFTTYGYAILPKLRNGP